MDGGTDGQIDRQMDRRSYRDAKTHDIHCMIMNSLKRESYSLGWIGWHLVKFAHLGVTVLCSTGFGAFSTNVGCLQLGCGIYNILRSSSLSPLSQSHTPGFHNRCQKLQLSHSSSHRNNMGFSSSSQTWTWEIVDNTNDVNGKSKLRKC